MAELIRILNIVGRMDKGGIETLIMNVYRIIDRDKIQFDFMAHYGKENADYNEEIRSLGGRIYEMPVIKTTEKTYYGRFFKYRAALKVFFREHPEYHIVHGYMTNTAAIYMPIAKKYGNVTTCIAHSHLSQTQKTVSSFAALGTDILRTSIKKCATDYFSCSKAAAHWLFRDEDIASGRVKIIKNGIDSESFDFSREKRKQVRDALGIKSNSIIGHVGRFFPQKNHSFIIDVFKKYLDKYNDKAILMLVGDGELKQEIEEKARSIGIFDKILFLGVRSDVNELMQAMDIFFIPSLYEGLPFVGVESQAAGLPLLASTEITDELNITGNVKFLALDDSIDLWADTMNDILTTYIRTRTKQQIIDAGYDIKKTVAWLEDFYLSRNIE